MRARTVVAAAAVFAAGVLLEHARARPQPALAAPVLLRPVGPYDLDRDVFGRGGLVDLGDENRRRPPRPPWGTWPSQVEGGPQ